MAYFISFIFEQGAPYRTGAEEIISAIYKVMKEEGKDKNLWQY